MGARRIEVLRGISMEIEHNEAVFLSGASGAGKTTLLYTPALQWQFGDAGAYTE
jgi:ABC-type lipoprotein export system ATPase subunit